MDQRKRRSGILDNVPAFNPIPSYLGSFADAMRGESVGNQLNAINAQVAQDGYRRHNLFQQEQQRQMAQQQQAAQAAESRRRFELQHGLAQRRIAADQLTARSSKSLSDARLKLLNEQTNLTAAKRRDLSLRGLSRDRNDYIKALDMLQKAETEEQWSAAQPIIQRIFGEQIPYNNRGFVLAQFQAVADDKKSQFDVSPEERELGITSNMKRDAAIQKRLSRMYGKPRVGHMWALGPDGEATQVMIGAGAGGKKWEAELQRQNAVLQNSIRNIDGAVQTMLGSSNVGRTIASGLENSTLGRFVASATGTDTLAQSFKDYEQGVLAAVYAMSGKQTTNAEMERFLGAFMPRAGDGASRIKLKNKRIKAMLRALQGSMNAGATFEEAQAKALSQSMPNQRQPTTGGWSIQRID